jgi:hypothetical protein
VGQQFQKLANMNPWERVRASVLKSMRITEKDLKSMSPQQRQAVEDKVRQTIEQELKKSTATKGATRGPVRVSPYRPGNRNCSPKRLTVNGGATG